MNPTAPDELASAQRTIAQLQTALDSRVVVEQAKGVLSVMADVDVDTAFRALRKFCRDRRIALQAVARDVVNRTFTDYNEVIALAHAVAPPRRSNSHSNSHSNGSANGRPNSRDIAADLVAWPQPSPDTFDARDVLVLAFENAGLGMTISVVLPGSALPRAVVINRAFADLLGYSTEDMLRSENQHQYTHPDDRDRDLAHMQALIASGKSATHWQKRYLHADGYVVWADVAVSLLRGSDGQPRYWLMQVHDITARREQEAELLERAEHDALTGLLNRSAFDQHAREQVRRCQRYDEHAGLLLIDLDDLKQINDSCGHMTGDKALLAVADALRGRLRDSDVAARIGGDEFVVLLPHTNPGEALQIADDITDMIEQTTLTSDASDISLNVSIGCTEISAATPSIERTLTEADRLMYAVKRRHHPER